jgi:hypothetical protein
VQRGICGAGGESLTRGGCARVGVLLAVCVASAFVAAHARPARAGLDLAGCDRPVSQPFLHWLDPSFYTPIGSFEQGESAWQLTGAASLVGGNEPWHVAGQGTEALSLRPGASALSPSFCVDLLTPTIRLFAQSASPLLPSTVAVSVELDTGDATLTLPVGVVIALPAWTPSLPLPLLANVTSVAGGSFATARLRLSAVTGETRVDDVYVDPFKTS